MKNNPSAFRTAFARAAIIGLAYIVLTSTPLGVALAFSAAYASPLLFLLVCLLAAGAVFWALFLPFVHAQGNSQLNGSSSPARSPREQQGADRMAHAIMTRNFAQVQQLIDCGTDLNAANEFGVTPLQMARNCDADEIVELLLKSGAQETGK